MGYSVLLHKATRETSTAASGLTREAVVKFANSIYEHYKTLARFDFAVSGLSVFIVTDEDAADVKTNFELNDPRIILQYGAY